MSSAKQKLQSVLEYTEKLLSLNERIVFNIEQSSIVTFRESELSGREGVELAKAGDAWITLQRLRETKPPKLPETISEWIKTETKPSPTKAPELINERCVRLSKTAIAELVADNRLAEEDILEPLVDRRDDKLDAILRIENFPEIASQWQAYLGGPWQAWADIEKPRRESISLYNKLYQIHQRIVSLGDDNPIELVLGCGIATWKKDERVIVSAIIEQLIETSLDEKGTLSLAPRTLNPTVNLKCFHALEIEGSDQVQREASALLEKVISDPDIEFSPFNRASYEKVLQTCASKLSASGRYQTGDKVEDREIPTPTNDLTIVDFWVLFARQRSDDVRKDDIRRLIRQVDNTETEEQLPAASRKFVEPPSEEKRYRSGIDLTGETLVLPDGPAGNPRWSTSGSNNSGDRFERQKGGQFFFPLPYNEDQVAIGEALKDADGVVVQGPPGTGKTHTIANIICHYLATQRRVLVTAKTPEALTALQEKLPEGIRNLAISIIHNDREGARQLESAMRVVTDEVKQASPRRLEEDLRDKQARLIDIGERLTEIDSELLDIANINLTEVVFNGTTFTPMKLAEFVANEKHLHEWFPDELSSDFSKPIPISVTHVDNVRNLRSHLGNDLQYKTALIASSDELPSLNEVLQASAKLKQSQTSGGRLSAGDIPLMSTTVKDAVELAHDLRDYLNELIAFRLNIRDSAWMKQLSEALTKCLEKKELFSEAKLLLEQWIELAAVGGPLLELGFANAFNDLDNEKLDQAIQELCLGKKPFGLLTFGKGDLREKVGAIKIDDHEPKSKMEWTSVRACRAWYRQVRTYLARWEKVGSKIGFPNHARDLIAGAKVIVAASRLVKQALLLIEGMPERLSEAKTLFPYGIQFSSQFDAGTSERTLDALNANLEKYDLADAHRTRDAIRALNQKQSTPSDNLIGALDALIASSDTTDHQLAQAWHSSFEELKRINGLRTHLETLDRLCEFIGQVGAPNWAQRLRLPSDATSDDPLTLPHWESSWKWSQAKSFIAEVTSVDRIKRLVSEQEALNAERQKLFVEIVRIRTFLGLKASLSDKIEAALSRFAAAIGRLGSGTGKSASRYRRIIRDSTAEAARAIPCWILPEWRVSEQIPAELGLFDLVIVDEASQSDITALSAIMRGKKVLIVGDDKQVSPTTIGIEERQIIQLRTTYLSGVPNADQMDPGSSLYELASTVFPSKAILLREHFRCVEPIIRFSSQFYPLPLIPLRLPTASQRLSPPLIDVYLPNGLKVRDTNTAEADYIVDEIRKIVGDDKLAGRTIGVISLIGDKQAKLIYDKLVAELGTDVLDRYRVTCGNAAAFQGQERDIVFLSMVECKKSATAKTSRIFAQRFNVAMSRARDRVYLIRSVSSSDLKSSDLKLKLIEHFKSPMEIGNVTVSKDILSLCESGFERAVATKLLELGYRIRPQVPVGGYRIDLVVEGAGDRRLAIELDGDKYHGPDRWAADIQRQRALERLGWKFWRCWGSHWISDKDGCFSDLLMTLANMSIHPIGAETVNEAWTEHRIIGGESETSSGPAAPNQLFEAGPVAQSTGILIPSSDGEIRTNALSPSIIVDPTRANSGVQNYERSNSDTADVKIGDLIVVRFNDNNKVLRVRLSDMENQPGSGIVHVSQPLGKALLGSSVDDEIDIDIAGITRRATVEKIERSLH